MSGRTNLARFSAYVLLCATVVATPLAFAQKQSNAASVTLVATLQESFAVEHIFVPGLQPSAQGEAAAGEVLLIFFQWRLRNGQSFLIEPTLETDEHQEPLLSPSGFVSLRYLVRPYPGPSFLPSREDATVMLGVFKDSADESAGRAGLLIGLTLPSQAEEHTVRIRIAIF